MNRLSLFGLSVLLAACGSTSNSTNDAPAPVAKNTPAAATPAPAPATAAYDFYGAGTPVDGAVAVDAALANPAAYAGKTVLLSGPIVGTCATKGCWMRLGSEQKNVFVKFKDYGFFVPTGGVEGRDAVINGELKVVTQSVEELKHYYEDAGKPDEAAKITEPRTVVTFMATGVAIKKSS